MKKLNSKLTLKDKKFEKLSTIQQMTMVMAMHIRNEMEDFHVKHLSDKQMKELNPIIRQAIYDVFKAGMSDSEKARKFRKFLVTMLPNYWEIPNKSKAC